MTFFSQKIGQFTYFAEQLGESDWSDKDVLDFGGNIGNLLRDPNSSVEPGRYWCIDVDGQAIDHGRRSYPTAHWLVYDRYCFFFNPTGTPGLKLPELRQRFDYIVAYSVFTNTTRQDMFELIEQLIALLKDDGRLAFTFIDPHYRSWPDEYHGNNLRWRLERSKNDNPHIDIDALEETARGARWCVLVNGHDLYVETEEIKACASEQERSYHVFHSEDYIKSLFPGAVVLSPANNEMQHCCIVGQDLAKPGRPLATSRHR